MFVSSQTFMKLVERMAKMEFEHKADVERLERRIKTLEDRPIVLADDTHKNPNDEDTFKLFEEMTRGVKDINTGRVVYTDGRD